MVSLLDGQRGQFLSLLISTVPLIGGYRSALSAATDNTTGPLHPVPGWSLISALWVPSTKL
ncbi:uncharacterized protein BDV14DRAFT_63372 [Aspergillus stella-maris]|uniref:uncharacterized protein n=1 Tax=Aspergillus stella-maris TaxID=1810926 RepID=UPI003CCE4CE8